MANSADRLQPSPEYIPTEHVGILLQEARLRSGQDLRIVADELRIKYHHLHAIEAGHFEDLPGSTYVVGFIRAYAEHLGLDADEIVRQYKEGPVQPAQSQSLEFPSTPSDGGVSAGALLLVALVLAGCAYGVWYWMSSTKTSLAELIPDIPARLSEFMNGQDPQGEPAADPPDAQPSTQGTETEPTGPDTATGSGLAALSPTPDEPPEPTNTDTQPADAAPEAGGTPPGGGANDDGPSEDTAPPANETPAGETPAGETPAGEAPAAADAPEPPPADAADSTGTAEVMDATPGAGAGDADAGPDADPDSAPPTETAETDTPSGEPDATAPAEGTAGEPTDAAADPAVPAVPETAPDAAETPTAAPDTAPSETAPSDTAPSDTGPEAPAPGNAAADAPDVPPEQTPEQTPEQAPEQTPEQPEEQAEEEDPTPAYVGRPAPSSVTQAAGGSRIVLRANRDAWIQLRRGGELVVRRLLRRGEVYAVPADGGYLLNTSNAGGLEVYVDGRRVRNLGPVGAARNGIRLSPGALN